MTTAAVFGVVGVVLGAVVTGLFTLYGPLALEKRRTRDELARAHLDDIKGLRIASIVWIDYLEGVILDLEEGRSVDRAEFRSAIASNLERLAEHKFSRISFDRTSLLDHLREASRCVEYDILRRQGPQAPRVSEETYMALQNAFVARSRLTPMLTGQTDSLLRRLQGPR